jgi:hypothetical protein
VGDAQVSEIREESERAAKSPAHFRCWEIRFSMLGGGFPTSVSRAGALLGGSPYRGIVIGLSRNGAAFLPILSEMA